MGWFILGGVALFVLFLLLIPVSLRVRLADGEEWRLTLTVCGIPVFRSPQKEKAFRVGDYTPHALAVRQRKEARTKARAKRKAEKRTKPASAGSAEAKKSSLWQEIRNFLPGNTLSEQLESLAGLCGKLLHLTARRARVTVRALSVTVSTPDVAQTALLYGAVSGAASCLWECLDSFFTVRTPHPERLGIGIDYLNGRMHYTVDFSFQIRVSGLLSLLLSALFSLLSRKDSQNNQIPKER